MLMSKLHQRLHQRCKARSDDFKNILVKLSKLTVEKEAELAEINPSCMITQIITRGDHFALKKVDLHMVERVMVLDLDAIFFLSKFCSCNCSGFSSKLASNLDVGPTKDHLCLA